MPRLFSTIFAVLALFLASCAAPQRDTSSAEVVAASEAWGAAYNSRDASRIAAMYSSDAVFWGTTMKSIATTPPAIFEYFKDAASRPNARVRFESHNARITGDGAVDAGSYTFYDAATGVARPARFTMVFARRDGRWVLVHHHSSYVP